MTEYTLAQIKTHPDFPFLDFLDKPLSFLMLELYWSQLFSEFIGEQHHEWSSLVKANTDGNPIFSATSMKHLRKVRVIHKINFDNKPSYPESRGLNTYYPFQPTLNMSLTQDGVTELNELILYCDLSTESEKQAIKLFSLHCLDLLSVSKLTSVIQEYEIKVGMPE